MPIQIRVAIFQAKRKTARPALPGRARNGARRLKLESPIAIIAVGKRSRSPQSKNRHRRVKPTLFRLIASEHRINGNARQRSEAPAFAADSQSQLDAVERFASAGSFTWRGAAGQLGVSAGLRRLFGLAAGDACTLSFLRRRIHPEDRPLLRKAIGRARSVGGEMQCICRVVTPDGCVTRVSVVVRRRRLDNGDAEYVGAVRDVTQPATVQECLAVARSELVYLARVVSLGALGASIAHELSQPVAGVLLNADTCVRCLRDEFPGSERARDAARRTLSDARRASQILDALHALFSNRPATRELVDLNELARDVLALSCNELRRHRIEARFAALDGAGLVLGDRVQLQQVILNLVLNARDAMSESVASPRELMIAVRLAPDNRVELSIRDSGSGLDPRFLTRLFQPFSTSKSEGLGMGLYISRSIIEDHGGYIEARSNEDSGATFAFSLPRAS